MHSRLIPIILILFAPVTAHSNPSITQIAIDPPKAPISVVDSKFYVGTRNSDKEDFTWKESTFVPLIPDNTCYSWEIKLDVMKVKVRLMEEYIAPSKPEVWSSDDDFNSMYFKKDKTVSVSEEDIMVEDGFLSHEWCVLKGDPTGNHKINIYLDGILKKSFEFVVGLKS